MADAQPKSQPYLPFSRPCISQAAIDEVGETLRSGWITSGPKVLAFEKAFAAYTGAKHAIAVCSATAGLDLAIATLDLKPGDEVITPSINWVSGPNLVELHGGTTVFADVLPDTLQVDPAAVAKLIGKRTRAIMPVHYAGAPCDLAALRALCPAGSGIVLIEDAAHAAGTTYRGRRVGGDSEIAVFSFHPTKNMTTAEGGMIVCQRDDLADRMRIGRFHGIRKDAWKNATRSGKDTYQVIAPGRKYNLTDIQAVLGNHQLADLERMNAERARLAGEYHRRLRGLTILKPLALPSHPEDRHAWHIFVVLFQPERLRGGRAEVVDRLEAAGIGTGLHFPAVHPQQYYARKYPGLRLPVSEAAGEHMLSLPLFPGMTDGDLDRVCVALTTIQKELGR